MNNAVKRLKGFLWSKKFRYLRVRYNNIVTGWQYFYITHDTWIKELNNMFYFKDVIVIRNDKIFIQDISLHGDMIINIEVI